MLRIPSLLLSLAMLTQLNAQNLQQIGKLAYPSLSLAGCWHHVDKNGGEWALVGTSAGLSIVDLSNPAQPVQRFSIPSLNSTWREVKTWAGYAYFGTEASPSGITIVNLNFLPDSIQTKVWRGDGFFIDKVERSHALQAEAGYLYICGGSSITNGVVIASLSDPWNPHILSKYAASYVHDAFIRGDTMWTSEIFSGQFGVVDITDRSNPVLLTTQPTPGAFNHNAGLSDDSKTLYTTDEVSGAPLAAFDVSNLNDIRLLDTYLLSKKPDGEVHNVRVMPGDFLVCPSYRGQLSIVDGSLPDNLIEIAWDSLGNSLVWDADPYLPSGIVFATAKNEGLVVYKKPAYTHAAWLEGTVSDAVTGFPLADAKVFVLSTPNADTTGANGIYKTGAATSGTYTLLAERVGYQSRIVSNVQLVSGVIAAVNIPLSPLVGTEEAELAPYAQIAPSPFEDELRVEIPEGNALSRHPANIRLLDYSGKIVLEAAAQSFGATVLSGLGKLPAGIYLIEVYQEKGLRYVQKLMKL